ncbi:propanediol utilization protein [Clostridium carboxidivorans P7]|uniref:Microcompartments protein n=1 Tax=Clostridium carboxidivorans P7 TaxID=536227 RepID=C6PNQ8_9CLOT|nr:BMC domain-containing protein [Clostridium carboxidivorans]AKN32813.1 propanediol utilization protein [Clostridium carboxidivorans P7]EET89185.1 microcompartments protein [Clostridium carboxidivorans P7]EFG89944.1 BMC domain protein [Clostridium carboxidivorans P7]
MQSLGLIETKGLLAAIEAADTMVKSADVSIIEKTYVGGGLVTISITGDVGAVKAAIEAGAAAVKKLHEQALVSEHVIPRPHEELKNIIGPNDSEEELTNVEGTDKAEVIEAESIEKLKVAEEAKIVEEINDLEKTEDNAEKNEDALDLGKMHKVNLENLHKDDIDKSVSQNGIEKAISILSKLTVVKLRNLAREYKDFVIAGRAISKANKNLLISKFKLYYEKK